MNSFFFFHPSELLYIPFYDMAHTDGSITASLSLLQKLFIIPIFLLNISFHQFCLFHLSTFLHFIFYNVMFNVLQEISVLLTWVKICEAIIGTIKTSLYIS